LSNDNEIDELFAGAPDAPMNGKGSYLAGDGDYDVQIEHVKRQKKFGGGNVFILEFTLLTSTNAAYPVGMKKSWTTKIENPNSFGDIKALMFAATGTDPRSVQQTNKAAHAQATTLARAACGSPTAIAELAQVNIPANFLIGRRVHLTTKTIKTKSSNYQNDFTVHNWAPYTAPAAPAAPAAQ